MPGSEDIRARGSPDGEKEIARFHPFAAQSRQVRDALRSDDLQTLKLVGRTSKPQSQYARQVDYRV